MSLSRLVYEWLVQKRVNKAGRAHLTVCLIKFRPKDLKLPKNFQFPGKGVIYDFFFDKSTFGTWHPWEKEVFIEEIPANAKVSQENIFKDLW